MECMRKMIGNWLGLDRCWHGFWDRDCDFSEKSGLQLLRLPLQPRARWLRSAHSRACIVVSGTSDFMSQHNSLRASGTTGAKRNVLKRFERVAVLKGRSQWKEGDRVTGLRKTRPPE